MIIEVDSDIFNGQDFQSLRHLVSIATYRYKHLLFVDLNLIQNHRLYQRLDNDEKALLEEMYNRHIQNTSKSNFMVSEKNGIYFSVNETIKYLEQPVFIILENSRNDAYFVDCLMNNFKKKGKKIRRFKEENWLKYENAGGKNNVENCVIGLLNQFENLPKENHFYLNAFVLLDSDKHSRTEAYSKELNKLMSFLNEKKIDFHILEKREMENYLPDSIIETIENNPLYLRLYMGMLPYQKDFFDIENGFPDKDFSSLSDEVQELYGSIDGIGYSFFRKNKLDFPNFKSDFPKLFLSPNVNQSNLLERTKHQMTPNELQEILEKITRLL